MDDRLCAIGVDLGGTKIEIAKVNASGTIQQRVRVGTNVKEGAEVVQNQILHAIQTLTEDQNQDVVAVGVGVAGQVDALSGIVHFAPNLQWKNVPLRENLSRVLNLPVAIVNDVRAATWGEWLYGAGQGCDDFICLFIGTGIGGGIVSGGHILSGCNNACGELGHMTIDLNGPACTCGNWGCLESLAGGWAIAKQARKSIESNPKAGRFLLEMADGRLEGVTAKVVVKAAQEGDELATVLLRNVEEALVAGAASLVNAFNPCRLILGGGFVEGYPEIIEKLHVGIPKRALEVSTRSLEVIPALLRQDAGVIGAAGLATHLFATKE